MFSYRYIQIGQFRDFKEALAACNAANSTNGHLYYLINDIGKEYYTDVWID